MYIRVDFDLCNNYLNTIYSARRELKSTIDETNLQT